MVFIINQGCCCPFCWCHSLSSSWRHCFAFFEVQSYSEGSEFYSPQFLSCPRQPLPVEWFLFRDSDPLLLSQRASLSPGGSPCDSASPTPSIVYVWKPWPWMLFRRLGWTWMPTHFHQLSLPLVFLELYLEECLFLLVALSWLAQTWSLTLLRLPCDYPCIRSTCIRIILPNQCFRAAVAYRLSVLFTPWILSVCSSVFATC